MSLPYRSRRQVAGVRACAVTAPGGPRGAGAGRHLARLRRGLPRLTLLLLITAQLADLATFGLAVRESGIGGELGPLRIAYYVGGFGAVACAKLIAVAVMLVIIQLYSRRTGGGRWLALVVAVMGVFGALTNVIALL
jgi:hypothetical protein